MNSRIFQIRKFSGLNQSAFAEKLSLTKNYISLIENGNRIPSERTIVDICNKFGINRDWLESGKGEMHTPISRDAAITDFMGDVMRGEDADFRRRLVAVLSKLETSEWELLEKMAIKLAGEVKKEDRA